MKNLIKILPILCLILILFTTPSYASSDLSWSSISGKANDFITIGERSAKNLDASALINSLANILTTIGAIIVLAGLLIIGIKYMVATPEEAAKLKTKLVGLVVAGVVILGAFGIWNLARTIFERNDKNININIKY